MLRYGQYLNDIGQYQIIDVVNVTNVTCFTFAMLQMTARSSEFLFKIN